MSGYWYMDGGDGRHFCYAKEPTFICPNSSELVDIIDIATGQVIRAGVPREPERSFITQPRHATAAMREAAERLGMNPTKLANMITGWHRRAGGRDRDGDGKLTDRCKACGAKMNRLGFRCWIEVEKSGEELRETGAQITQALGGTPTKVLKSFHLDTKREAQSWAREEAALAKHVKESDR